MASTKRKKAKSTDHADWEIGDDGAKVFRELVGYNLRRAHAIQRKRFADAFKAHNIRPVQLSMLGLIYKNPDLQPSELGRVLDIKRANIVPLIDELQERKLVERKQSSDDGRFRVLALTRKGQQLTRKLIDRHDALENDLARQLGPNNRKQLLKLLMAFRKIGPPEGLED
jgi:DNA-binding MarR family transcriptional regulator